jgi:hypothetical protein
MQAQLQLGEITIDVVWKDIRNVHLSVHPPTGRVTIAAPLRIPLDTIRLFAISKLGWIRQQQNKLLKQEREAPREYLSRESHYVWGRRYLLSIVESEGPTSVELRHSRLVLNARPDWDQTRKQMVIERWYRDLLRAAVPPLCAKWEPILGVQAERFYVQRMKTQWGSCNTQSRTIRLNTDLAKKPRECLEYILVHELLHIIEPTHNARFQSLLQTYMPKWQSYRQTLNQLPVRHESWEY